MADSGDDSDASDDFSQLWPAAAPRVPRPATLIRPPREGHMSRPPRCGMCCRVYRRVRYAACTTDAVWVAFYSFITLALQYLVLSTLGF